MAKRNTKQLIIERALTLFSVDGYDGVSVRQIAAAVGIKESSLYKHYKNKQDIFDSIIKEMKVRYIKAEELFQMPVGETKEVAQAYFTISQGELLSISTKLFMFFLQDEFASQFRRLLVIEQYKNKTAADTLKEFYLKAPLEFQSTLFDLLMKKGGFHKADPETVALHFYGPIYLLLNQYDNCPEKIEEALGKLEKHVIQFTKLYAI